MFSMTDSRRNSGDDALRLAVFAVLGSLAAAAVAGAYAQEARDAGAVVAWAHIRPCSALARRFAWIAELPGVGDWLFKPCASADVLLSKSGARGLDFENWLAVQAVAGRVAAVAYAMPLAWAASRSLRLRPDLAFRVRHSLDSLIRAQSETMRTSRICRREDEFSRSDFSPFDAVRLRKERERACSSLLVRAGGLLNETPAPVRPRPWASALRPEDWLICQGIGFGELPNSPNPDRLSSDAANRRMRRHWDDVSVDDASEAFEEQIGPIWRGLKSLPPAEQALAAAFANFFGYRYASAGQLLNRLGSIASRQPVRKWRMQRSVASDQFIGGEVAAALASRSGMEIERRAKRHAWERTAFIAILEAARKDRGIVASASFSWLKKENRPLWYVLGNGGNSACCAEAAMACAHYRAEVQLGRPLFRPAAFQASRSLVEEYLDSRPERIKARRDKLDRERKLGEELDESSLAKGTARAPTPSLREFGMRT